MNEKLVYKLLYYFVGIFPFGLAAIAAINSFHAIFSGELISVLIILCFILILLTLSRLQPKNHIKEIHFILALVGVTIFLRYLVMIFLDVQFSADFLDAFAISKNFSHGPYPDVRSARFPYWGFYKITLSQIMRIFGRNLTSVQILNLTLTGLSALGLYFLVKLSSLSKRTASIAVIIYALNPADLLYKTLPTGEHIFVMLLPFAVIIFLLSYETINKNRVLAMIGFILSGITIGLMELYKPVGILLMIALIAIMMVKVLFAEKINLRRLTNQSLWYYFLFIGLLFFSFQITKTVGLNSVSRMARHQVNKSGFGWTLRIGMDIEKGGTWDRDTHFYMISLYEETNENYGLVNSILIDEVKEMTQKNKSMLLSHFIRKFDDTWKSNYDFYHWTIVVRDDQLVDNDPYDLSIIFPLLNAHLIFSLVFSSFGAIYCASLKRDLISSGLALFIVFYTFLLLITETQMRYRSILFTTTPIFIGYGILGVNLGMNGLLKFVKQMIGRYKQSKN